MKHHLITVGICITMFLILATISRFQNSIDKAVCEIRSGTECKQVWVPTVKAARAVRT